MIFNTDPVAVSFAFQSAEERGMLRTTTVQEELGITALQGETHYIIAGNINTTGGRYVTSLAELDNDGFLKPHSLAGSPPLFAVISRVISPDSPQYTNEHSVNFLQQIHVLAERRALEEGVYKPNGRVTAELLALSRLKGPNIREAYVTGRLIHLAGIYKYIEGHKGSDKDGIALESVINAQDAIRNQA
jgi:hypothetical protein